MKSNSKSRLKEIVRSFRDKRVVVFGDIMLDHFIRGKVGRISPEAPVPVVHVQQETYLPGGAGNVASNLAALGADTVLVSVIGADPAGAMLLESLKSRKINVSRVETDTQRPTTQKIRIIAEHQQVVRFDRESSRALEPGLAKKCMEHLAELAKKSQGVILSDYGKGMLTGHNIPAVIAQCRKNKIPVCVDPKVEHFKRYRKVSCITPNTKEAWEGMRLHPKDGQDGIVALGKNILKSLSLESVLITQGPNGMTLLENKSPLHIHHIPTAAKEVYDVTGAGDTVISVFTLALASGANFTDAAEIANRAAGIVVGKLGTAVVSPEELIGALDE